MNSSLIESVVVRVNPESSLRVSVVPVTRAQYKRVMFDQPCGLEHPIFSKHPWRWMLHSDNLPATGVSYLEATRWIESLNAAEGRTGSRVWRLPNSRGEWNAICRAGRGESGFDWWTKADHAAEGWFALDGVGIPPVKARRPSPAGLYDLWTVQTWLAEPDDHATATHVGHDWHDDQPYDAWPLGGQSAPRTEQSPFVGLRLVCDDTEETGNLARRNWVWDSPEAVAEAVARDRRLRVFTKADLARLREE